MYLTTIQYGDCYEVQDASGDTVARLIFRNRKGQLSVAFDGNKGTKLLLQKEAAENGKRNLS